MHGKPAVRGALWSRTGSAVGGRPRARTIAAKRAWLTALVIGASLFGAASFAAAPGFAEDLQSLPGLQNPGTVDPSDTGAPIGGTEQPQLEDEDTRAWVMPDGDQLIRDYQGPVNYQDASGDWEPIANTLVPTFEPGYSYRNQANSYVAELPQDLQSPVRFTLRDDSVEMALEGARSVGLPDGPSDRFPAALPGVTAEYTAANDQLKESLVLADATAQSSFRFLITTSDGLSARSNKAGGVDFARDGEVKFSFAAPYMQDSSGTIQGLSGAVHLDLANTSSGYEVTLSADRDWLDAKDRVWPVAIDPTVTLRSNAECTISQDPASVMAGCSHLAVLGVGKPSNPSYADRSLFRFGLSGIPADARVDDATFGLTTYLPPQVQASLSVHAITNDWTTRVSWSNRDDGLFWTQPGGDFGAPVATTQIAPGASGVYTWNLTSLVQGWLNRSVANKGILLKSSEVAGDYTMFASSLYPFYGSSYWPYLQVRWSPQGHHISLPSKTWVVDDGSGDVPRVNAVESWGNTVYLGGDFTYVGPRTGSAASLRIAAEGNNGIGSYDQSYAEVAGIAAPNASGTEVPVRAIVADGSGGWYIGGDFKYVGGAPRQRLAHVRSDGSVDPAFSPSINGTVYALAISGNALYVGGSFSQVGGYARRALAKLDASNGALDQTFDARFNVGDEVRALALGGGRLCVGGSFANHAGVDGPVSNLVALDPTSALPRFSPFSGADGTVTAIAATSTTVYFGGQFTHAGGFPRNHIAAFDDYGDVTDWDPNADGSVDSLLVSSTRIYAGGTFANIGQRAPSIATWTSAASRCTSPRRDRPTPTRSSCSTAGLSTGTCGVARSRCSRSTTG